MKLEPGCLFSSLSDTCHPDEVDHHPHHDSCNIHTIPRTRQDLVVSSSGQLNTNKTRCRQIIPKRKANETSHHRSRVPNSSAQNQYTFNHDNYTPKRCRRFLSLPILLILLLSMPSIIYPTLAMQKGAAIQKSEQLQQKDQLVEMVIILAFILITLIDHVSITGRRS